MSVTPSPDGPKGAVEACGLGQLFMSRLFRLAVEGSGMRYDGEADPPGVLQRVFGYQGCGCSPDGGEMELSLSYDLRGLGSDGGLPRLPKPGGGFYAPRGTISLRVEFPVLAFACAALGAEKALQADLVDVNRGFELEYQGCQESAGAELALLL